MSKIYICSPLNAPTQEGIRENMEAAKAYERLVSKLAGSRASAPHAYLPEFLDDGNPDDREMAMSFCLQYLRTCGMLVVCGNRVTSGMEKEIQAAKNANIPVRYLRVKAVTDRKGCK